MGLKSGDGLQLVFGGALQGTQVGGTPPC
jgi:hypothetical protein